MLNKLERLEATFQITDRILIGNPEVENTLIQQFSSCVNLQRIEFHAE
jgi:hypothetical protein